MNKILRAIKEKTRIRTHFKTLCFLLNNAGLRETLHQVKLAIVKRLPWIKNATTGQKFAKDVLFVSIDEPLLDRYRVQHMMESLESVNMTCDRVLYYELTSEMARRYNAFIFYRTPYEKNMDEFFKVAKAENKPTFFAIDDLVFDTKYTNNKPEILAMSKEDKKLFDDGVQRHGKVAKLCDYGIATTTVLQNEMKKFGFKDVILDRNKMSLAMVYYSDKAIEEVERGNNKIIIGYFSGTATHNADFEMIAPALAKIMDENENVFVKLAGRVDAPEQLRNYRDRLIFTPYVDYKKLPFELRKADIVLAPLQDTLFNCAKSEIKWSEASLVKTPVIASNIGAYAEMIEDGRTGLLAENTAEDWFKNIKKMVDDLQLRQKIADRAYEEVRRTAMTTGVNAINLKNKIAEKIPEVIGFVGVSLQNISGGNIIIEKHMDILRNHGKIVYGIETHNYRPGDKFLTKLVHDFSYLPINSEVRGHRISLDMRFDQLVATFWSTMDFVESYSKTSQRKYLVQNFEPEFYDKIQPEYLDAVKTYNLRDVKYATISRWCQRWLKDEFSQSASYVSNGIELANYPPIKRKPFAGRKVKILIEGDSASKHKRVDESFRIANKLDREKFEVSYLSYNGKPKDWYIVDHFYNKISPKEVYKIYQANDILLKSSVLESFSLPPLEIMATGGIVVLARNEGNAEYVKDGENALYYKNEIDAVNKINRIVSSVTIQERLHANGRSTAMAYDWSNKENSVLLIY